ncbi:MAG: PAS domain S-box protein, partial [Desulfobulbaceae bacterium]|nr:PAS domain S-box protein [Desulfobulbaceae bacterium]
MKEDEAMRGAAGEFGATAGSSLERAAESIRVLAERLAEEECRCRTFLQEVPFAVQIFDREGTQRTVNAAWEELWQARAADGIGKYNVLGDPQAESLGVADLFRRALAGESLSCPDFSFDPAVSGFPGRKRWLRSRIFPLRGPDGAVAEVAIIHEDISDLKRSEEFHRLIINHASDAVVIVRDGRLVFCNPMALALIGARSEEELLGREFSTFICPDDLDMVADIHARRLLGEKVASRYQFRIIDRQGEPRWMEASVALFEWEHAPAIVGFLSDVTDRRLIEQELADYRHHLEELIRERTRNLDELLTFSRILTATTDLRSLYREVTRLSRQLLGFDFSSLMLLAEDKSRLVMEDTIGFAESSVGTFSLVRGEGLSTYVVLAKQPAMVVDFGSESRFEIPPVVFAEKITSALGVPMMIDEEVFGVLIGHTRSRREFGAAEVALYQSLANQSAVAIKNVRHLKSLRESEQKFRLLFENAHDAIYLIDMETARIVQCNRRAAE